MANTYYYISLASYIVALVFLAISVFLFFKFDIMKIIGDLSGRNAKKSVEAMRRKVIEKDDTSTSLGSRINSELKTEKLEEICDDTEADTVHLEADEDATIYLDKSEDSTVHLQASSYDRDDIEATQLLTEEKKDGASGFVVEREITLIHTNESLL